MLWDRCGRAELPAWARNAGADADTATGEEHGGASASDAIVRPSPSFEHPAGSHLRLLGTKRSGHKICREPTAGASVPAICCFRRRAGIRNYRHICG